MPFVCPHCREENDRLWVVEDLDQPFGCTGCIRKRGLQAVEASLAAREAWPDLPKEQRSHRITLALSDDGKATAEGEAMTGVTASVQLIHAAARLLGRRSKEPPTTL